MDDNDNRRKCIRKIKDLEVELKKLGIPTEDLRAFKRAVIEPIVNEAVKKTLEEMGGD